MSYGLGAHRASEPDIIRKDCRWDGGGVLANGPLLGLGGGLLLWPSTLASRDLLEVLMAPGASEVGSATCSGGPCGTTCSSAAGAGGGGLLGIVGSRFLGSRFLVAKVASSVDDIWIHWSSTRCST